MSTTALQAQSEKFESMVSRYVAILTIATTSTLEEHIVRAEAQMFIIEESAMEVGLYNCLLSRVYTN